MVSIIVPIYNVEKYLLECLQSIDKIKVPKEVLLINDGTKDNSRSIACEFIKDKPEFKLYDKKNGGLSDARNYGLDHCKGEYVCFIDSDDYINPEYFDKCVESINDEDITIFDYVKIFPDGKIKCSLISKSNFKEKRNNSDPIFDIMCVNNDIDVTAWKSIYKKEFLTHANLRFIRGLLHEDVTFSLQAYYLADTIKFFEKEVYFYRQGRKTSIMNTKNKKNDLSRMFNLKFLLDFIKENSIHSNAMDNMMISMYYYLVRYAKINNLELSSLMKNVKPHNLKALAQKAFITIKKNRVDIVYDEEFSGFGM